MNNDETTLLSPQYSGNGASGSTAPTNIDPRNQSDNNLPPRNKDQKTGWGEKAAYAAGGAVFGAGMTMAGQAMASSSAPKDDLAAEISDPEPDEVKVEANAAPEAQEVDEVAGVTIETGDTRVHVSGNADIEINNGSVHVTNEAASPSETVVPEPVVEKPAVADAPSNVDINEAQGSAPVPEDVIVATATGVRVAQVDDDASFSQAFADARAQVGPGGIFEWHGRVYGTYYKDEWDNMSPAERHDFQANIDYNDVLTDESMTQHHNDMAHHGSYNHSSHDDYDNHGGNGGSTQDNTYHRDDYTDDVVVDDEVHVLDVAQTDLNDDGIPEDAALLEVDGQEIIIVDIDQDGIADVAITDIDGDGEMDFGDISGEGIIMPGQSDGDLYLAQNDAPDYMNDADVGSYMA